MEKQLLAVWLGGSVPCQQAPREHGTKRSCCRCVPAQNPVYNKHNVQRMHGREKKRQGNNFWSVCV